MSEIPSTALMLERLTYFYKGNLEDDMVIDDSVQGYLFLKEINSLHSQRKMQSLVQNKKHLERKFQKSNSIDFVPGNSACSTGFFHKENEGGIDFFQISILI